MGLYANIDIDFAKRTLKIIDQYDSNKQRGPENFEVTLLVNCLVGLLILPHERRLASVPNVTSEAFDEWGLKSSFIRSWGGKSAEEKTLRVLLRRLRNSVAHFRIEAEGSEHDIERLRFSDQNGFQAIIPVANLKIFVKKLASAIGDAGNN